MMRLLRRTPDYELRVLMVCTGNICRSPAAEGVLRTRLTERGLQHRVGVSSAGTHAHRGWAPDPRTLASAARRGYDLSSLRGRTLDEAMLASSDLVLAMDLENLEHLRRRCPPELHGRLGLLLQRCPVEDGVVEVPDPYYGGPDGFERVLDLLEPACRALASSLARDLGLE